MMGVLWWLAQTTAVAAVAVAVVAVACRLFRDRPAVQHALWLVVLFKFLAPPIVVWSWTWQLQQPEAPIAREEPRPIVATAAPEPTPTPDVPPQPIPIDLGEVEPLPISIATEPVPGFAVAAPPSVVAPVTPAAPPSRGTWGADHWALAAGMVWLVGAGCVAATQARRIARFRRVVRGGVPAPASLCREVRAVAERMGVRCPPVHLSAAVATPLVWAWARPRIFWPASLALDDGATRGIVAHELAHLKRRDHWVAWLELAASCLWWWNPVYWIARRRLREAAEHACDALALGVVPEVRRRYAEALLDLARSARSTAACAPATAVLGQHLGAKQSFHRRLAMILNDRVRGTFTWRGRIAALLLALIALPAWSLGQTPEPPAATPTPAATPAPVPEPPPTPAALPSPTPEAVIQPPATVPAEPALEPIAALPPPQPVAAPVPTELPSAAPLQPNRTPRPTLPRRGPGGFRPDETAYRLQALEAQLQALMAEVRALRSQLAPPPPGLAPPTPAPAVSLPTIPRNTRSIPPPRRDVFPPAEELDPPASAPRTAQMPLIRALYELPNEHVRSLVAFLDEYFPDLTEVTVEDQRLIVTGRADHINVITSLVTLKDGRLLTKDSSSIHRKVRPRSEELKTEAVRP